MIRNWLTGLQLADCGLLAAVVVLSQGDGHDGKRLRIRTARAGANQSHTNRRQDLRCREPRRRRTVRSGAVRRLQDQSPSCDGSAVLPSTASPLPCIPTKNRSKQREQEIPAAVFLFRVSSCSISYPWYCHAIRGPLFSMRCRSNSSSAERRISCPLFSCLSRLSWSAPLELTLGTVGRGVSRLGFEFRRRRPAALRPVRV